MPSYRFKFYDPNSRSEKLGAAVLADDNEAVAFAERVMRELIRSDEELYATWMTKITEKERTVASMPFASEAVDPDRGGDFTTAMSGASRARR
jgi:hypothetical protein